MAALEFRAFASDVKAWVRLYAGSQQATQEGAGVGQQAGRRAAVLAFCSCEGGCWRPGCRKLFGGLSQRLTTPPPSWPCARALRGPLHPTTPKSKRRRRSAASPGEVAAQRPSLRLSPDEEENDPKAGVFAEMALGETFAASRPLACEVGRAKDAGPGGFEFLPFSICRTVG